MTNQSKNGLDVIHIQEIARVVLCKKILPSNSRVTKARELVLINFMRCTVKGLLYCMNDTDTPVLFAIEPNRSLTVPRSIS